MESSAVWIVAACRTPQGRFLGGLASWSAAQLGVAAARAAIEADRLIAATARAEGVPLVTRDEGIRASKLLKTIW